MVFNFFCDAFIILTWHLSEVVAVAPIVLLGVVGGWIRKGGMGAVIPMVVGCVVAREFPPICSYCYY